ncbi:hypothetical protein [Pseudoalteromonas spongiae]|uniref:hypothetical protein n=1 Tax=Pseudoalteromonas spongiae TaxID=298657 RepID=UPI0037369BC1
MKHLILIMGMLFCIACANKQNEYEPERMADLASQLKDIAAALDGTLKFSDTHYTEGQQLLQDTINDDTNRLAPFNQYQLHVIIDKNNAALLLCDNNTLLIEDAGCTAQSDVQHWRQPNNECKATLALSQICN